MNEKKINKKLNMFNKNKQARKNEQQKHFKQKKEGKSSHRNR